jgi:hypothetical protein
MGTVNVTHVPDAGHMIPWDDEEGFYRAFGDFLGVPLAALAGLTKLNTEGVKHGDQRLRFD